ncbi:MAG: paraslipin, partial [Pseudobdellovibrionaceae bacterium]
MIDSMLIFVGFGAVVVAYLAINITVKIVPQQQVWVLERLGKFQSSLQPGLSFVLPFIDVVRYKHQLKEVVLDIPAQACITKDNVSVQVDGVIFYRVIDPIKASYGIHNYQEGVIQMAQTTLRSEIGKIDLDRTFEEREKINSAVIIALEEVTE